MHLLHVCVEGWRTRRHDEQRAELVSLLDAVALVRVVPVCVAPEPVQVALAIWPADAFELRDRHLRKARPERPQALGATARNYLGALAQDQEIHTGPFFR